METPISSIEALFEKLEEFVKTTLELSKLKLLKATINVVNALVHRLAVILMISMFALVFNIGVALWLGELLGRTYFGFFIVAGFYLVAGILSHFFLHKWLKKPISAMIIQHMLQ